MAKRLTALLISILLCFCSLPLVGGADENAEFAFDERLVYGGGAVDGDGGTYFSDTENKGALSFTPDGGKTVRVLCRKKASYINISGGRIYFIAGGIYSCNPDGSGLNRHYPDGRELSCLYVDGVYIYFMVGTAAYRLRRGKAELLFAESEMKAFMPLTTDEFRWYADNPNYIPDDGIGSAEQPLYITYLYKLGTGESRPEQPKAEVVTAVGDYEGPIVKIGDISLPLAEHMPGTFFSKNGKACPDCHYDRSIDCVATPWDCNCMRYYPTGDPNDCDIDLYGSQCFGFARLIFYKCFGFTDHEFFNSDKFYSVGSLEAGTVTERTVKNLLMKAGTGAHVRLAFGHSVSILTMDEDFLVVYHANAGGDGVASEPCVISTRRFTWEQFAAWAVRGVLYVNMPYDYPESITVMPRVYREGLYRVDENLSVREGASTSFERLMVYQAGVYENVFEVYGNWGRTSDGWMCLDYCTFYTAGEIKPAEDSVFSADTQNSSLLLCTADCVTYGDLLESLSDQEAYGYSTSGAALSEGDMLTTGCRIAIEIDGRAFSEKYVVILGDINRNGKVDIGDYIAARRIFLGVYTPPEYGADAGDVNRDGKIDAPDLLLIARYLISGK